MFRLPLAARIGTWRSVTLTGPLARLTRPLARFTGEPKRFWLGTCLALLLALLLSSNLIPDRVSLKIGDSSPEDIRAQRTVTYIDTQETARMRKRTEQRIPNVYDAVDYATGEVLTNVSDTFTLIKPERDDVDSSTATGVHELRIRLPIDLSDATVRLLLHMPSDALFALQTAAEQLAAKEMSRELKDIPSDLPAAVERVHAEVRRTFTSYSPDERIALAEVVGNSLRANRVLNVKRTEFLRDEERKAVGPVRLQIMRGDIVLHKDDRVTRQHIDKLQALGLQQPALNWMRMAFLALVFGVLILLFSHMVRQLHPAVSSDFNRLVLIAILVTVSVLGLKIGASVLGLKVTGSTIGYLNMLWIATATMLVSVLVGPNVAIVVSALLSVGTGLGLDIELRYVAAAFTSGLAGVVAASRLRDRSCLIRMGLTLTATNVALVLFLSGMGGDLLDNVFLGLGWAVGCGIGSPLLFWLGIALLEKPLGVTTHIGLLELCDTNRPVLRRLLMEAPGTYHHCMVVAGLVESAAEAIGADSLLCRAMAYYHDIGKLRRPHFFIENQRVENVHDRLNPSLSMLVIAAHVKDGIEMAREMKLPPPVTDGIREHHGTGLVRYFFHQAVESQGSSAELESQFRYDGPKPQTKETAILMLADGIEAASRILTRPTPGQIDDLVNRIIHERLSDGQLDECDLTFRDTEIISKTFARTLLGMLHSRIEYPKVITTVEARKALKYAALDSKSKAGPRTEAPAVEKSGASSAAG